MRCDSGWQRRARRRRLGDAQWDLLRLLGFSSQAQRFRAPEGARVLRRLASSSCSQCGRLLAARLTALGPIATR